MPRSKVEQQVQASNELPGLIRLAETRDARLAKAAYIDAFKKAQQSQLRSDEIAAEQLLRVLRGALRGAKICGNVPQRKLIDFWQQEALAQQTVPAVEPPDPDTSARRYWASALNALVARHPVGR